MECANSPTSLGGATASGWLADRLGRRTPLIISILWYSVCNLAAGLSPSFAFLFVARALLGIGMGAEWPAGAALAMESWPVRSRGFMSGVLQGSWGLGFALSALRPSGEAASSSESALAAVAPREPASSM